MPAPTKKESPTETKSRLQATLANLQDQKATLIGTFPSIEAAAFAGVISTTKPRSAQSLALGVSDVDTKTTSEKNDNAENLRDEDYESTKLRQQPDEKTLETAQAVIKRHINLLHNYNEIRDIGQGLLGLIAEQRGVRVVDVMEEFGADAKD